MALYNGGYPASYTPMFQTYTPVQVPSQNVQANVQGGLIWVQGEAGAKSYLVAPNNTVQLWDSESQTIYLKSADASGMPSMKVLDYTIRETAGNGQKKPVIDSEGISITYATKDEIRAISDQIEALRDRVDSLSRKREKEVSDE